MTTITTIKSDTRFLGLPRNRTGLFAADTIHEVKPTRNQSITVPPLSPQFRHNTSTNLLLASSEQNHHQLQQYRSSNNEIQQYYPIDKNQGSVVDSSNDSRLTSSGIRNGFRPSTVRHPKLRSTTATTQRMKNYYENKELPPKSAIAQTHASAKLRSEIGQINNKLIKHNKQSSKSFRIQNSRELVETPQSVLSYASSYRDSSASTILTADRIHQRFSSALTNNTTQIRSIMPAINDVPSRTTQINSGIAGPSPAQLLNQTDDRRQQQQEISEYRTTHAYQIPQQSNVGSESIFLTDPPLISPIKIPSVKYNNRSKDNKFVSCPFYVMYLTNLAMQQRQENDTNNKENDISRFTMPSTIRKVPVNSRTSTANPKYHLIRRQVNSPISMNTYSTIDDDDRMTNSTSIHFNKRLSSKLSTGDHDNSYMLRDILKTTPWNHVQV